MTTTTTTLTGSEKQIAWAEQIRTDALKHFESIRAQLTPERLAMGDEQQQANCRKLLDLLSEWRQVTEAAWWIDRRHMLETKGGVQQMAYKVLTDPDGFEQHIKSVRSR